MVTGKGRAASPIRPGLICKHTLLGEIPLRETGEFVTEAAITQLFDAYRGEVDRVNSLRSRERRIRGMRYSSFYTMFRFAQLLNLVEHIRDEPADYKRKAIVTTQTTLLRIERGPRGAAHVVTSSRRVFRLTELGRLDEICWSDLTNAWKLGVQCGQPLEYLPPTQAPPTEPLPAKPKAPTPPVEKPAGFSPYVWSEKPSVARFRSLLKHLYVLRELGLDATGVRKEVDRLSSFVGDWIIDTEDSLDDAEAVNNRRAINMYGTRLQLLTRADEALGDEDLDEAISAMEGLVR
jgi:hypothetical protein